MNTEIRRSNWWYLLPIVFSFIGGLVSYFAIKNNDPEKAKYCLSVGLLLSFGIIGGIIAYVILRRDYPDKAKIFLYLGIILTVIGFALNILFAAQIGQLEREFGFDVNV